MEAPIKHGLRTRTVVLEWLVSDSEDTPAPPDGYIVAFVPFLERGLSSPPHRFLRGLLHHYTLELQHLNSNGIQHIVAFIALCEGYLAIKPHFELWRYFFTVSLYKKREKGRLDRSVLMGCAGIHL
jgi:hypothetical protein